jgi:hypothetical protein
MDYLSEEFNMGRKRVWINEVKCTVCDKIFIHRKDITGKYCSKECVNKGRCKKVIIKCLVCNKEILCKLSEHRKYCSLSCYWMLANKNRIIIPKCSNCGKDAVRNNGVARKLCNECFNNLFRVANRTIADLILGSKDPQNKYRKIRFNAKWVLDRSGIIKICSKCGYSKHVEVCHVKAISDFTLDTKISIVNSLSNLMYLCPNCHWEFDNKISQLSEMGSR